MNILIADDDKLFTHLAASRLKAKGCRVEIAHDAMQAVMYAVRSSPDVIVLDINMPGGTGFGALTTLKRSTRTEPIPVLVVSASTSPGDEQKALGLGAAKFLRKPLDPEALYAALLRATGAAEPVPVA